MTSPLRPAFVTGGIGHLLAAACSLVILRDPPGSAIRPMDVPMYLLMIALGTLIVGLPQAGAGWRASRRVLPTMAAVAWCLTPLFTGLLAFHGLVAYCGYILKP